jgi:hypothetical protein
VADLLDDLINAILENTPEPQPSKAEASVVNTQNETPQKEDNDLTWKQIPVLKIRKLKLTCSTCRTKLKGGTWQWYYKHPDGEVYWWCCKCMASINCLPSEEELKHAEKSTKV